AGRERSNVCGLPVGEVSVPVSEAGLETEYARLNAPVGTLRRHLTSKATRVTAAPTKTARTVESLESLNAQVGFVFRQKFSQPWKVQLWSGDGGCGPGFSVSVTVTPCAVV